MIKAFFIRKKKIARAIAEARVKAQERTREIYEDKMNHALQEQKFELYSIHDRNIKEKDKIIKQIKKERDSVKSEFNMFRREVSEFENFLEMFEPLMFNAFERIGEGVGMMKGQKDKIIDIKRMIDLKIKKSRKLNYSDVSGGRFVEIEEKENLV